MQWEYLTANELKEAAKKLKVCIIAFGVIEKHGDHLPLGTDYLVAHKIACLAAEKEPAVVFPPFYFGQIYEARCYPGTVTIKPALLVELIQAVFDEIGRNGFKKIIAYNGHGGNTYLLKFIAQASLWEEKPYSIYIPISRLSEDRKKEWDSLVNTKIHGHACECETSILLAIYPDLVKMNKVPKKAGAPLNRLKHLPPTFTGIHWYANYPDHYAGDARAANKQKGEALLKLLVDSLAEYIAAVKNDNVVPLLSCEFFNRVKKLER